jgi:hypothetical protein
MDAGRGRQVKSTDMTVPMPILRPTPSWSVFDHRMVRMIPSRTRSKSTRLIAASSERLRPPANPISSKGRSRRSLSRSASCRRLRFVSTRTRSRARRRNGSRSARTARCGIRRSVDTWRGVRGPKSAPVDGQHELFRFLTTDASGRRRAHSSEGDACHPDDISRGRFVAFSRHVEDSRIATTIVASGDKEVGPREAAIPYRIKTQCFRFDCVGRLQRTKSPVFGRNAQIPAIRRGLGELVKSTRSGRSGR